MAKLKTKSKRTIIAWLLLAPALIVFSLMILYPFLNSVKMSFFSAHLLFDKSEFVGLANYQKIFANGYVFDLLGTTVVFVLFATLCPFIIGLLWAVLMNEKFKGSEFFRGLTLVNWIIPGIAISFLWSWIFNGDYGVLNAILFKLGIIDEYIVWFGGGDTAMIAVIVARTWQMFPWYMSFILGALQGVSQDQLEAARIDGANNWQNFLHVVLPSIMPVLSLVFIMGTIGNFQHFDLINVMTGGGPEGSTSTFATVVYRTAFKEYDLGKAAAFGVIWAILLGCFSFVYVKRIKED